MVFSRVASRCSSRCSRNGCSVVLVQGLQRVGVRGVAGLGALGLRHVQLVEQHDLQLLGRAEVDLLADHPVRVLRGLLHPGREVRLQVLQLLGRPSRCRPPRSPPSTRSAAAAPGRAAASCRRSRPAPASSVSARSATARARRISAMRQAFGVVVLARTSQRQLAVAASSVVRAQLAVQVAQHEVVPARSDRWPGRARYAASAVSLVRPLNVQPRAAQRVQRALDVVAGLGHLGVGEPRGQRRSSSSGQRRHVDVAAGPRRPRPARSRSTSPAARRPGGRAADSPIRRPVRACAASQSATVPGATRPPATSKPSSASGSADCERGEQPVAQHPELQVVEQPVHGVAVPRLRPPGRRVDSSARPDQLGQLAVEQHGGQVRAQRVPGLAPDLVDPVDQVAQRAELADPLRGRLLADARDARQVVRRVAAQRREVRVLLRR